MRNQIATNLMMFEGVYVCFFNGDMQYFLAYSTFNNSHMLFNILVYLTEHCPTCGFVTRRDVREVRY